MTDKITCTHYIIKRMYNSVVDCFDYYCVECDVEICMCDDMTSWHSMEAHRFDHD